MNIPFTFKSLLFGAGAMLAVSFFASAIPTPADAQPAWRGGGGRGGGMALRGGMGGRNWGGGPAFRGPGFRGPGFRGGPAFRGAQFRGGPGFRGPGFRRAGFRQAYYGGRPGWNRAAWRGWNRPAWRGGYYGPRWRGGWYRPGWRGGWYRPAYYGYYGYPGYYYDRWGTGAALATGLLIGAAGTAIATQASQADYCYRAPRRVVVNGVWRVRQVRVCRY
ncbi:hypothetical protein ACFQU1_04720 [Chelatococcus sp. GCM10030263]|uniref:hypothetical protein n=1 Tax=Chelatococcus sp. GCM10030263 TaxID=3273387 RepID=UPI00360F3698